MMWKLVTQLASRGGPRGSLAVVYFHRVLTAADPLQPDEPTAAHFEQVLVWLKSQFNVLPLREAVRRLDDGSLPPAAAAITFDDGYRDNLEVAVPVLQRQGLPATFFIATGFLDGGIMFNDIVIETIRRWRGDRIDLAAFGLGELPTQSAEQRIAAIGAVLKSVKHQPLAERRTAVEALAHACGSPLPRDLMMSSAQVRAMAAAGFEIGAHTEQHPILARAPDSVAMDEMARGRDRLEALIDRQVALFAYPNGRWIDDFDHRHRDMARALGFEAAFNTEPGVCTAEADRWNLPRFTPWDRTATRFRARMLLNQNKRPVFA